jgi:hypothetical protein
VDRGYPKQSAVRYVSDHHRLPEEQRFVLIRVIVPAKIARARAAKALSLALLHAEEVYVDGYNVLIAVESLLAGYPVYSCDDGFLRDTRGIFRSYKISEYTLPALTEILDLLRLASPERVEVLLDQQISRSGELAGKMREQMASRGLRGGASTLKDVDRKLKSVWGIVATSDGNVIDAAARAVDIPAEIARRRGAKLLTLTVKPPDFCH